MGRSSNTEEKKKQQEMEIAHADAFAVVCDSVLKEVVEMKQIVRLEELREQYVKELNKTQYSNPNYRADKLKSKLEKHDTIGKEVGFLNLLDNTCKNVKGRFNSQIVFCKTMGLGKALTLAYNLGSVDSIKEVATMIRTSILNGFQSSEKLPWPPTAEYLQSLGDVVPEMLQRFLTIVFQDMIQLTI